MVTHSNKPSSIYKGFMYLPYEDRFLGRIRIKPAKRKFWGEVRRIASKHTALHCERIYPRIHRTESMQKSGEM